MPFAISSRWSIFLAAWLYPIFALRFVRTQPLWRGVLLLFAGSVLVTFVVLQGMTELPGIYYVLGIVEACLAGTLPFLIDRALAPRLGGLLGLFALVGIAIMRRRKAGEAELVASSSAAEVPPEYPPVEVATISS
jgi:apolipoprotein N-acyltransferase